MQITIRNFITVGFLTTTVFLTIVGRLKHMKATNVTTFLYKQLTVERNILKNVEAKVSSIGCSLTFIVLVIAFAQAVTYVGDKNLTPFLFAVMILVFVFIVASIGFDICCSIYQNAVTVLHQWKLQLVVERQNKKYLRRTLKSFRPVSFPLGKIGIIDRDMMLNYFRSALGSTVDLLVTINA